MSFIKLFRTKQEAEKHGEIMLNAIKACTSLDGLVSCVYLERCNYYSCFVHSQVSQHGMYLQVKPTTWFNIDSDNEVEKSVNMPTPWYKAEASCYFERTPLHGQSGPFCSNVQEAVKQAVDLLKKRINDGFLPLLSSLDNCLLKQNRS